jgi:hypothetical protein
VPSNGKCRFVLSGLKPPDSQSTAPPATLLLRTHPAAVRREPDHIDGEELKRFFFFSFLSFFFFLALARSG